MGGGSNPSPQERQISRHLTPVLLELFPETRAQQPLLRANANLRPCDIERDAEVRISSWSAYSPARMRSCFPRCRTDSQPKTAATGASSMDAIMRAKPGRGVFGSHSQAKNIPALSSASPQSPLCAMTSDCRFGPVNRLRRNGYSHSTHIATSSSTARPKRPVTALVPRSA